MTLARTALVTIAPDVAWVDTDDRIVVLRLADLDQAPLVFEGTAAVIWLGLQHPIAVDDLAEALAEEFAAPVDAVRADVVTWLDEAVGLGVVTTA